MSRIEIEKQAMHFSAGHFTIFSKTERENLHGHNYHLLCDATAPLGQDGLMFNYAILKKILRGFCDEIDEQVILPEFSPYLKLGKVVLEGKGLEGTGNYVTARFNGETLLFLERDVTVLPIANATVEALSHYFLERMRVSEALKNYGIVKLTVKVSSSLGQYGVAEWMAPEGTE